MAAIDPPQAPAGPRPHPRAGTALGLGLAGLFGAFFVLPLVLSPLACYYGAVARRDVEAEPMRWSARGNGTAGLVLGVLGTGLLLVLAVGLLAAAALGTLTLSLDTGYGS